MPAIINLAEEKETDEKTELIAQVHEFYRAIFMQGPGQEETPQEFLKRKVYKISVALLLASALGETELFNKINKATYEILPTDALKSELTYWQWLLSRKLLAAKIGNDDKTARELKTALKAIENIVPTPTLDKFAAWAKGYQLAFYALTDQNSYKKHKVAAIASIDLLARDQASKEKRSDYMWVTTLIIFAAALANDSKTYYGLIAQLKETATVKMVSAILKNHIPIDDYLAWAGALLFNAAAIMRDQNTYDDLNKFLPNAIHNSPSKEDQLLAKVNVALAEANFNKSYCVRFTETLYSSYLSFTTSVSSCFFAVKKKIITDSLNSQVSSARKTI